MRRVLAGISAALILCAGSAASAETVAELGADFWAWRAQTQPASGDDIPRIVRPAVWAPDWSATSIEERYRRLGSYEARWQALAGEANGAEAATDHRLVGSALARVRWELDHVAAWRRQPHFYVAQALNPIFELLLPPPPLERARIDDVIRLLGHAPAPLAAGKTNLTDMRGPFVDAALAQVAQVPSSLNGMVAGIDPHATPGQRRQLRTAADKAIAAFADFEAFLKARRAGLSDATAVGRDSYRYFLGSVALYPYSPEELQVMGRQEWARSVLFEELERN